MLQFVNPAKHKLGDVEDEINYYDEGEDKRDDVQALEEIQKQLIGQNSFYMSPLLRKELRKIHDLVWKKDRDWVGVVDGDEGSGKSVLAMQICKELDPDFGIDNIVYNADDFMDKIKKARKGQAILLDEGYAAANARASLSEVNRALVGLATEMRQKNLFVVICLPSFFDLDKYFAIHRSRVLFHVYFNAQGERGQFIVFPKTAKKLLFLNGKKNYSYAEPKSPWPPMRFLPYYVVDEEQYRANKAQAFKGRTASNRAKVWMQQRDAFIKELYFRFQLSQEEISRIPAKHETKGVSQQAIAKILLGKSRF